MNEDISRLVARAGYLYSWEQRRISVQDYLDIVALMGEMRKHRKIARQAGRLAGLK